MATRVMRVIGPTAATALLGVVVVLVLHLTTGWKISWWEWLVVAVLTVISAGVSFWLQRRRSFPVEYWLAEPEEARSQTARLAEPRDYDLLNYAQLHRKVNRLEDEIYRVGQQAMFKSWTLQVHELQRLVNESKYEIESLRVELRSLSELLFVVASTISDDHTVPRSTIRVIPLVYYISSDDPKIADEVERAISEIVEASGFVPKWVNPRKTGSIWRKFFASSKRILSSDEAKDAGKKIARAVELQIHEIPQSQVDSALAEGVSKLLAALERTDSAFVQLGSVIVLKVDGVPIVFSLTQLQISALNKEPTLFRNPRLLLEKLQSLRTEANGAHTGDVRSDIDAAAGVSDARTCADIPPTASLAAGDHLEPVQDGPEVPESRRFCPNPKCHIRVGRAQNGHPGQAEGCCPRCGTRFCFTPLLRPGALVGDGQFRVERAITHDWPGWSYLTWDCRVPRWVVLASLVDPDNPDNSRHPAVTELAALAQAPHPNIVTVHAVVTHQHPLTGTLMDYLVREHISGKSLEQLRQERPDSDPCLPVEQVCEFALCVLAALGHLHVQCGLLYCGLSADNVISSPNGVKLIELRYVRRIDDQDSPIWGKRGYQDPEIVLHGPSVTTDLYTVARMMAVLSIPFPHFVDDHPIPGPSERELFDQHPSFHDLLLRATSQDPHRRFTSAADMAEQLKSVLREINAQQ